MPATYSINVGTPTEALRKQDINSVLLELPDNTQKLISPKDVRDAFLSAWATSAFKQTIGQANIEYLGIDSGNPESRDIKEKIFIGKRNYAGSDIMNNSLLTNVDNDIYFYNTKPDSSATQSTRIVILSGTNSTLHTYAPYIESAPINSNTALSLNLTNPSLFSGPINIYSSTGRVSINGITFPTVAETSASASNGKVLKYSGTYPNGVLKWDEPTVSISNIGSVGQPTNIYGSTVSVNGYSLEFVDNNIVPKTVGGIIQGSSFSAGSFNGQNWPLSEVIRKILYPYVPPTLSLGITSSSSNIYFSTGLTQSAIFNYSITRYSYDIYSYNISGTTYSGLSYSSSVGSQLYATFSSNIFSNTAGTQSFTLSARDNNTLMSFSHSATASVRFVHPFFYGFDAINIDLYGGSPVTRASQLGTYMNSASRLAVPYIGPSQSISVPYSGSGYIYFAVPSTYPLLSKIKDPNGFVVHDSNLLSISAFTYSSPIQPSGANNLASPVPLWTVYKTLLICSYTGSGNFEFIF